MDIVLNDESVVNDYGFRILNSGIDWTRFNLNPVVLLNHDVNDMAIGTIDPLSIRTEGSKKIATLTWDKNDDRPNIKTLIAKYENGVQKAFSSGLLVTQLDKSGDVPVATQSEYYELSAVTIPSNRNTVRLMNKAGSIIPLSTAAGQKVTLSYDGNNIDFSKIETSSNMEDIKKIALLLGLADTATVEQILEAINGMKAQNTADASEMAQLRSVRVESALEKATAKGIVNDTNRDFFKAQLTTDFANTQKMIDSLPTTAKTLHTEPQKDNTATLLALLQSNANKGGEGQTKDPNNRDNWTFDEWSKRDAPALIKLKANDKPRFEALLAAHRLANPV